MKRTIILTLLMISLLSVGASGITKEDYDVKCKAFGDFVDDKPWDVELESYSGTYCMVNAGLNVTCRSSSEETYHPELYVCIDTQDLRVYEITRGAMNYVLQVS